MSELRVNVDERRSLRIGVLGAGRLGSALAAALVSCGYGLSVASRSRERVEALAATPGIEPAAGAGELAGSCDLVFLAVPDGAIAEVTGEHPWRSGQGVVHCSGALGLDVLGPAAARGAMAGCLHPLQTFPAGTAVEAAAPALFHSITCGIEGAEPLGATLEAIAADLGARGVRLEGIDRALYHAAAVLMSNDVVALVSAAARTWALAGLPADEAREALAPLLRAAATNVGALPLERALTGPVARGDVATVERHLLALEAAPELQELYRRLALELLRLDLDHSETVEAELRTLLERG